MEAAFAVCRRMEREMQAEDCGIRYAESFATRACARVVSCRPSFYLRSPSGEIVGRLGTHVDDFLWAVKPEYEDAIQGILDEFHIKDIQESNLPMLRTRRRPSR